MKPKPSPELEKIFEEFDLKNRMKDLIKRPVAEPKGKLEYKRALEQTDMIIKKWIKDIDNLKSQLKSLIQAKDDKIKELERRVKELEQEYDWLEDTTSNQENKIKHLKNELKVWKFEYKKLEKSKVNEIVKLRKEIEKLSNIKSKEFKEILEKPYHKQIEILEAKLKEREKTITALEKDLDTTTRQGYDFLDEITRLKQQLKSFKKSVIKIVDERIEELKKQGRKGRYWDAFHEIAPHQMIIIKELQQLKKRLEKEI